MHHNKKSMADTTVSSRKWEGGESNTGNVGQAQGDSPNCQRNIVLDLTGAKQGNYATQLQKN